MWVALNEFGQNDTKFKWPWPHWILIQNRMFWQFTVCCCQQKSFFPHFFTRNSPVRKIKLVCIFCCCSNIKSERQTQSRPPRVTVATICSSAAENGEARSRSFSPCCWSSSSSLSSSSFLLVLQKEEAGQMDAKAPLGSSWWVRASWRLIWRSPPPSPPSLAAT